MKALHDGDPLTLPAATITRTWLTGPRCGQVEHIPATAISAAECENALRRAENRARAAAYRGWQSYCRWSREESA